MQFIWGCKLFATEYISPCPREVKHWYRFVLVWSICVCILYI